MGQSSADGGDHHHHHHTPATECDQSSSPPSSPQQQQVGFQYVRRLCRERGLLFEDPNFQLSSKMNFGRQKHHTLAAVVWTRPFEICARPKFISTNTTRFDIEQGELGECWLMAAVSCLAMTPALLERVVPTDQGFHTASHYCGLFRFRFWRFGDWVEVLVDDRLPTTPKGRPLYLRSADPAEFWPALLEKAYAKFSGGYSQLLGCRTAQVLQDLTGGIVQSFRIAEHDPHVMLQTINSSITRSSLLASSILSDNRIPTRLRNGLVTQHAYSITGLARVRTRVGEVPLIRLRNPLGKGEWNGPWSDRSWEWDTLPERDQELLSVRVRNDGEFWMSFEDFTRHFTIVDLLHIGPDDWMLETSLHSRRPWRAVLARRRWRAGFNAGGHCSRDTAVANPQFRVHIGQNSGKKCHLVISIMQQYHWGSISPSECTKRSPTLLPVGFAIYEVPGNTLRLTSQFVSNHQALDIVTPSAAREVVRFFSLPSGDFTIVPFTQLPDCETRFLLRILTDEVSNIWEVNDDNLVFRELTFSNVGDAATLQGNLPILQKLMNKLPNEIDVVLLHKILRACWRSVHILCEKPSLELIRNLIMLRDPMITGKFSKNELPGLLCTLQQWTGIFLKIDHSNKNRTNSFNFRKLLWEAGLSVSNKVLECLVLRFTKNSSLTSEAFLLALVKLYLAHERYTSLEKKLKESTLSLEEMLLLTVYS